MVISLKQHLVNTFGGRCQLCGYDKCLSALDFHHRDPSKKDFNISRYRRKDIENYIFLRELEKCILICANCHREIHSGMHSEIIEQIPEIYLIEDTL